MKTTKHALSLLAGIGTGRAAVPSAPPVSMPGLPDGFGASCVAEWGLFADQNAVVNPANQECSFTVWPRGARPSLDT